MRIAIALVGLAGCGACEKMAENSDKFEVDMAPLLGEYASIDIATLPHGELTLVKGRKVLNIRDGELHSPFTPFGTLQNYATTPAMVGVVILQRNERVEPPARKYLGGGQGYDAWCTEAVIARPESRLVYLRRSWDSAPDLAYGASIEVTPDKPRVPGCPTASGIVDALAAGREPSNQLHQADSSFVAPVLEHIAAVASQPGDTSKEKLEGYLDYEIKTDSLDQSTISKLTELVANTK